MCILWFRRFIVLGLFFAIGIKGYSQTDPEIRSKVDTTFIKIGEQLKFTITVEADSTDQVIFPEGQTFSPLETVEAFATDTMRKKDRMTLQKIYALTQFDSGAYKLPSQRIEINGKGYFTDSLEISVATVPVDTVAQKMYDIKGLMQVPRSNSEIWKVLMYVLLGLLVLAGGIYWFLFRKKPLTEEEKIASLPPYDRALLELKKLENSKYLIQDEYKQYYTELTGIVRAYLEEDVHVTALESTTDELITKLELLKDAGELKIDNDTLYQFKRILQTADLVKFAKSKPATTVAEQDRKSIEQIVIKTHEALPEPTEEELLEQEAYQEILAKKAYRKKWILAGSIALGALLMAMAGVSAYFGPKIVWDTVTQNPTKKLLDSEWVASSYGYPPINLETPEVLVRQKNTIPAEAKAQIADLQTFSYENKSKLFSIATTSMTFTQSAEPELDKTIDDLIKNFERKGAKNITTKQEEFTTLTGVKGIKTYGSGQFKVPDSDRSIKANYIILSFGGKGFQQQVLLTWEGNDVYAQEIVDRILSTVEVKAQV
ncbi:MAG: BatD family protein [Maribacter sp.]|nr:BatD family protein [Maribacter sp.]